MLFRSPKGGWFPLLVAVIIVVMMTTWRTGRRAVAERMETGHRPIEEFIAHLPEHVVRVPGVAAFMYRGSAIAPPALRTNVRHNHALHEVVLLVSVTADSEAYISGERVIVESLGNGCHQVTIRHGYMETSDVPRDLEGITVGSRVIDASEITYFLGRETVISTPVPTMAQWREKLFAIQLRSAASAARFFDLPPDQVVEVGSQVEI